MVSSMPTSPGKLLLTRCSHTWEVYSKKAPLTAAANVYSVLPQSDSRKEQRNYTNAILIRLQDHTEGYIFLLNMSSSPQLKSCYI